VLVVFFSRFPVSFRGAHAPLAELDGLRSAPLARTHPRRDQHSVSLFLRFLGAEAESVGAPFF
jgi:hypothetical protein